jgi:hypothetical protein
MVCEASVNKGNNDEKGKAHQNEHYHNILELPFHFEPKPTLAKQTNHYTPTNTL